MKQFLERLKLLNGVEPESCFRIKIAFKTYCTISSSRLTVKLFQDFLIRHYAGDVVYNIGSFIDKNRDTLFQDFKRLLFNSRNEIYK